MADTPDPIETRVQLAEARTDTKLAELLGEMRTGFAKIDGQFSALNGVVNARLTSVEHSVSGLRATILGTGIGVVAVVIAVMAYGQAWFGSGLATRDLVKAVASEYHQQAAPAPNAPPLK